MLKRTRMCAVLVSVIVTLVLSTSTRLVDVVLAVPVCICADGISNASSDPNSNATRIEGAVVAVPASVLCCPLTVRAPAALRTSVRPVIVTEPISPPPPVERPTACTSPSMSTACCIERFPVLPEMEPAIAASIKESPASVNICERPSISSSDAEVVVSLATVSVILSNTFPPSSCSAIATSVICVEVKVVALSVLCSPIIVCDPAAKSPLLKTTPTAPRSVALLCLL